MKKRILILSLVLMVVVIVLTILPYDISVWSQKVGEQQRIIEVEVAPNVIDTADRFTGFNNLENVQITAEQVVIAEEEDDSPIAMIHSRIVGRPLWRVTYTASLPEWQGKRNPYIQAFEVLLDAGDRSLLKVSSKWAEDIDLKFKEGARISRRQIASIIRDNHVISAVLPKEPPSKKLIASLTQAAGAFIDVKHIEWYYIAIGEDNTPVWLKITHGGPPPIPTGPMPWEAVERMVEEARLGNVAVARYSLWNVREGTLIESTEMVSTP
jgi:hypothetical protein